MENTLKGKNIIVGVTGGIAAYKTATLVREFVKMGADVKIVMTEMAKQFITPLTLATLSKNPILVDFFDPENGAWNSHVSLGIWADAYVIAPATANTIAKMANGVADNLLLTTYLSAKCPVFVAPAMDLDMYAHPATQKNIETLRSFGNIIIEPGTGFLASGLEGKGRMEEPDKIASTVASFFKQEKDLAGKKIVITAGPTYEKIDPVRFIGNHSSGKMGYALADECAKRGASVTIVSGPVSVKPEEKNVQIINVTSASEMCKATTEIAPEADIVILCAAVADYTPEKTEERKIKREKTGAMTINLVPTTDIAATVGKDKRDGQIFIGFALETDNEEFNAIDKCKRKNLDFIIMNSLNDANAGFKYDTNKITIFDKDGNKVPYGLKPKKNVAKDIIDYTVKHYLF